MSCVDPLTGFFTDCGEPGAVPFTSGTVVGQTGGGTISQPSVNIGLTVNQLTQVGVVNQVNVANQILEALQQGIQDAIARGAQQASDIAHQTEQEITTALSQQVGAITNAAQGLFGGVIDFIKAGLSSLAQNVGTIVRGIVDNIGPIISKVADVATQIFNQVGSLIQQVSQQINTINSQFIQPIANIVLGTIQTISTLTQVIEKDLHEGITGLLQLPTDIANGLGSLDATIDRSVEQMHNNNKALVDVNWKTAAEDSIGTHLKSLGELLTKQQQEMVSGTTFKDGVKLNQPDINTAAFKDIQAIWQELEGLYSALTHGGKDKLDAFAGSLPVVSSLLAITAASPSYIVGLAGIAVACFLPFFYFVKDDINAKTALAKLNPGDALEAWRRGFIDGNDLQTELSFQGWDSKRIEVMKDLENTLIGANEALDMYFRGIMSVNDLTETLKEHGYDQAQSQALTEAAAHVFDISTATTAYRQGRLSAQELSQILQIHHFTDNEIQSYISTLAKPVGTVDFLGRVTRGFIEGRFLTGDSHYTSIPEGFQNAALSESLDSDTATERWHASFTIPALHDWVSLYFRGVRTKEELDAVMDYYRVPVSLRDDVILAHRSLIPWRTIPTMVAKGIISEAYAKQQLLAHGFDETATVALLNYAAASHAATKATASGDLQASSVATARNLWDIGAISDDQYETVLESHGYTKEQAALVVQAERFALLAKERRQIATDITSEVVSGIISIEQANAQMSANNFSDAERSKVINAVHRAQRQNSKTPGESEMRKMVEKGAITVDDYRQGLSVLGYSQTWVDAFVKTFLGGTNGSTATA